MMSHCSNSEIYVLDLTNYLRGNGVVTIINCRGSGLSRSDLVLDWLPIFNQYERIVQGKEKHITEAGIQAAVLASTCFYEKGAEKEIWKRVSCLTFAPVA